MFVSRLWPLVLVAALGTVPIGPQEHVHEATDDHGHHTLIAHRHEALHGLDAEPMDQHGVVDHPDPITIVPDATYTAPAAYAFAGPLSMAVQLLTPPAVPVVNRALRASDKLIHAPPRAPSSLRAPPSSSLL